jgi:hypothetical protein
MRDLDAAKTIRIFTSMNKQYSPSNTRGILFNQIQAKYFEVLLPGCGKVGLCHCEKR